MSEPETALPLVRLLHELLNAGYEFQDLSYHRIWEGAVARRYPAHQVNGRWRFFPTDLPRIAAAYSLRRKPRDPRRAA